MQGTILDYDGREADIELVNQLPENGARLDVEHEDGRRWRLNVTRSGDAEIVTARLDAERAEPDHIVDAKGDREIPYDQVAFAEARQP